MNPTSTTTAPGRSCLALVIALALALLISACTGAQDVESDKYGTTADAAYQTGQDYQAAGNFAEAEKAYAASLDKNPRFVMARYNLAVVQIEQGEKQPARDNLARVVELDPNLAGAHSTLATLHLDLNSPEEAITAADKALALEPDLTDALIVRATALDQLGRDDEALAAYERLMNLGSEVKESSMRIALLLLKAGKLREGTDRLRSLVANYPTDISLKVALGRAYFSNREFDNAIDILKTVVEADESQALAHLLLGRSYLQRGQEPLALIALQKAEKGLPDNAEVFVALGEVELRRGYTDRALNYVQKALQIDDQQIDAYLLDAAIHKRLKDKNGVEEALTHVLKLNPRHIEAARELAAHYRDAGRPADAVRTFTPFVEANTATNADRILGADLAEAAQDPARAATWLRAAIDNGAGDELLQRLVRLAVPRPDHAGIAPGDLVSLADRLHQSALGGTADSLLLLVDALVANNEKDRAREILKAAARTFKGDARLARKLREIK